MPFKILFRSNTKLKEINIKYLDDIELEDASEFAYNIGKAPFIFLHTPKSDTGGLMFDARDIIKLKLYNNKFYPYMDIIFRDPTNLITDKLHPIDDSIISFFKRSESDLLMPIRLDFTITNFRMIKKKPDEKTDRIYYIRANLSFNNITENRSYKGTSFSVIQKLARISELGFASNISDTSDEMVWINPGNYVSEFIPDIVRYSYKDDNSFLFSFIDLYYNLNYIDIEQQLSEDSLEQRSIWNETILNNDEIVTQLLMTNHPNMMSTNMYIDKYNLENSAREVNWDIGYDAQVFFYDKTTNTANNYQLDTISDPYSADKIILKSFDKKTNTRKYYVGFQDQDNVHKNFLYSKKQNENNIEFLQKIRMNIILNNPNLSLYRFQNIEIILYELNKLYEDEIEKKGYSWKINERLSGDWLISGINYIYEGNKLTQEITVVKRELTKVYNKERLDQLTQGFVNYGKEYQIND